MTKLICAIILSVTLLSCGPKKPDIDKDRINAVCDKFMQLMVNGNVAESFLLLKPNSTISHSSLDAIQMTSSNQFKSLFPTYGKIISSEFITEKRVKDFIAKRFYVLKFDNYYLKFDFTLYNNGKSWVITSFNYNDELIELLY
jgi:hypothetical protein